MLSVPRMRVFATAMPRLAGYSLRFASNKRLVPDPDKVPRTEPIDLRDEAFRKTNTIEDFSVYDHVTPPNNIDLLLKDGFSLSNGARVISTPERPRGLLLLGHEAYELDLSQGGIEGLETGRIDFSESLLATLDIIYPKPELIVIGLGKGSRILGEKTSRHLRSRGIRAEVGNTQHGASHFDLLATERGQIIGGIMLPPNM